MSQLIGISADSALTAALGEPLLSVPCKYQAADTVGLIVYAAGSVTQRSCGSSGLKSPRQKARLRQSPLKTVSVQSKACRHVADGLPESEESDGILIYMGKQAEEHTERWEH